MNRWILFPIILLAFPVIACSQVNYPVDFRSPLDIELDASGSFCELRSNHFHAGMDFRTQRREGLSVYAVHDGYVSRVKISHFGYGKAVYITHPNGYTSVYAHLSAFAVPLDAFVSRQHTALESYEMDIFPDSASIPVRKGQVIAYSGNTGGSQGAHLHFEIRDTKTEETINPLFFGIKLRDTKPPRFNKLRVYPIGEGSFVNGAANPIDIVIAKNKEGRYYFKNGEKINLSGRFAFGVEVDDPHDVSGFRNGIYEMSMEFDGKKEYAVTFDRIAFDELRYINAHVDYGETMRSGRKIERLFLLPNDALRNYARGMNDGYLSAPAPGPHTVKIILKDQPGNTSSMTFNVNVLESIPTQSHSDCDLPYCIGYNRGQTFESEGCKVVFPPNSLYQDLYLSYQRSTTLNAFGFPTYTIADAYTPVHKSITVFLQCKPSDKIPAEKYLVAYRNLKNDIRSYGGTWKDGWITASVNDLGAYTVMADTMAPVIRPLNAKDSASVKIADGIRISVTDDLSGIKKYRATLDGKWILVEYEYKQNLLFHKFSAPVVPGYRLLELEVWDERGNRAFYRATVKVE